MSVAHILLACLILGACTTADIVLPDGTQVHFSRMWTDAAIAINEEGFTYSSNASDVAQQATLNALLRALGLATGGKPTMLHMNETGL